MSDQQPPPDDLRAAVLAQAEAWERHAGEQQDAVAVVYRECGLRLRQLAREVDAGVGGRGAAVPADAADGWFDPRQLQQAIHRLRVAVQRAQVEGGDSLVRGFERAIERGELDE